MPNGSGRTGTNNDGMHMSAAGHSKTNVPLQARWVCPRWVCHDPGGGECASHPSSSIPLL